MDTEYIIENLRFEIIKPYHNLSGFKSKYRKDNKYLKKEALKDQKHSDRVTHLVICNAELIAYFSLHVNFDGMPAEDYECAYRKIGSLPPIDRIPHVEITHFAIDKKYECYQLASVIFDNIIYNTKEIFSKNSNFDGVSISVGDACNFPEGPKISEEEYEKLLENMNIPGRHFVVCKHGGD